MGASRLPAVSFASYPSSSRNLRSVADCSCKGSLSVLFASCPAQALRPVFGEEEEVFSLVFSQCGRAPPVCVCVLILVICFQEPSLSGFQKALARRNGLQD